MKILALLLISALLGGCAYRGNVHINSPVGDGNSVEKVVHADAKASVTP